MKLNYTQFIHLLLGVLISSCTHTTKNAEFDSKLIEGEWTTGKYPYRDLIFEESKFYDSDEVDSLFNYKISSDSLIIINEGTISKAYKILKLTEDSLTLKLIPHEVLQGYDNKSFHEGEEKVFHKLTEREIYEKYLNSVKGHIEKDTIIGNFTGLGIDTLYVSTVENFPEVSEDLQPGSLEYYMEYQHFYARSNNPEIPDVEILGMPYGAPQLVYEGDLDGDGRNEWGFLPVWMNSQWRTYRVYNYDPQNKRWRHLYYDLPDNSSIRLLSTPEYVRESGYDLVEKGPEPGLIKIHYGEYDGIVYDTIIRPNYVPIDSEHF